MNRREFILYALSIIFATVWELVLAYNGRAIIEYYVDWVVVSESPPISWSKYSPSLEFVLLVLLPALVLFGLYLWFRESALKKSALSISLPILSVIIACFKTTGPGVLLVLIVVSAVVGGVVGKDKWEKAILGIAGFLSGFMVAMIIMGGLSAR
ncbi:hypothetical protein [Thermococcus sp. 21S7]|uniref:hypothetical protein n=1 Tax=Thermococcus sp. 21S7 TaxID=1638221 RepID=UPI00143C8B98|nr:hypothetical protein [Thermococcus sp. 21S7]NJE61068.1 hypothetical protein [Thermococcus sp. 21S7]